MPVEFECPHCQALIDQTKKNRELPRVACSKCSKEFSTQWARTDADQTRLQDYARSLAGDALKVIVPHESMTTTL